MEYSCKNKGHIWVEHGINDVFDDNGNMKPFKHLMVDHGDRYRFCKVCGHRQFLIPAKWQDTYIPNNLMEG
jgi:hypothetical protein